MSRAIGTLAVIAGVIGIAVVGLTRFHAYAEIITDTTPIPPVGALGGPYRDMTPDETDTFLAGRRIFDHDFHIAEGLGQDFNGDSCRSCHHTPAIGGAGPIGVNVFRFARDFGGAGPFEDLPGGQAASRQRIPTLPGREDQHSDADVFEQRNTPPLFGLGSIDGISDATILANEDPSDSDGDGIYGVARIRMVNGSPEVGRFGWKAQMPTLADFTADGMANEVGITCPDPDGRGFALIADTDGVADPELSQQDFDDAVFFIGMLAQPARVHPTDPEVMAGEQLFSDVGCATCHIPSLDGDEGPVPLYSDLLLHDIHPADYRGMEEPGAGAGVFRTPPLWGARLSAPYLHDASAETVNDAIMRHTGEAEGVRQNYEALTSGERDALLKFVNDL